MTLDASGTSRLTSALNDLAAFPGVGHVVLLGRDGLVVEQVGEKPEQGELIAASVPAIQDSADVLGGELHGRETGTIVVDLGKSVVLIQPVSSDLTLGVLVQPGAGFGKLLAELRDHAGELSLLL